ncbi:MAG: tRNA-(ms[2]io[6]A)-hydroxylase [Psychroserpens sp.]|jgi:tRNA-(ms[2]io[6]A)-hydroxylase
MKNVCTHEPAKLSDTLIWGVYIDARSCERFSKLAPHVDDELKNYIPLYYVQKSYIFKTI